MKLFILFTLFLVLLAAAVGSPAKGSTKPSLKKKCLKDCGEDYSPVCGTDDTGRKLSFGSECVLSNYNCEQSANLRMLSKGECPGGQGIRLS